MKASVKRRHIVGTAALAAGIAAVLGVATFISRVFIERPNPRATAPLLPGRGPVKPAAPAMFRVANIEGLLETQTEGGWSYVAAGDYLPPQAVLRTLPDARAILRRGAIEIEIRDNVVIRLEELAERTARFGVLAAGVISAAVDTHDEAVEIGALETTTRNRGAARWVVSLGSRGRVDVATSRGQVGFSARGKEVLVREGEESSAPPGQTPSEPQPIPAELLLSVFWPEVQARGGASPLRGKTQASTRVKINGTPVDVRDDGQFAVPVPLQIGANQVSVEARDIAGRRKVVTSKVVREPPAPALESTKEDLWRQ